MIKKYISKFTIDILPSIIATIVGAYIVNHYIIPKAGSDRPAAAVASTPDAGIDSRAVVASPADKSSDAADAPSAGPRGRIEKAGADKSDKDLANAPLSKRHQPAIREKAVARTTPTPVVTPPAAVASVTPAETAPVVDGRHDVNDLARAAIERLRGSRETSSKEAPSRDAPTATEAARAPEPPSMKDASLAVTASPAQPPSLQQLPPPIVVSTPAIEAYGAAPSRPPFVERTADPRRPRPPGEIPSPLPLDLQADAGSARDRTTVAEDVLSAAKSVFHSVIPRQFER